MAEIKQTATAKLNNIRISPRKLQEVVDKVRGKRIAAVREKLEFVNKRAAGFVIKAIDSAVANAVNNHGMSKDDLKISEIYVTKGLDYKRGKPVARGRYHQILKKGSNLTLTVSQ